MTRTPMGRLVGTADGTELVVSRTFRAGIDDVWASVTEPERTARWYGTWTGEAGPGRTIKVQMAYEDEAPWMEMRIDACEPPRRLALSAREGDNVWRIELRLHHEQGSTGLSLVHHLEPTDMEQVGSYGPGWEWYLDNLVAAREDTPQPSFDDYYPAMKEYYDSLRA
ncbi:SRPBCC family protein [Paractinoplanes rishiriensis]|uniref:Activator of Hsp90 ATPase homologue 1/2-like C-terminal domain-containing protein n=1 Tax=Paractinoplanes rishiriensis TaxID=1050105 RepID=A0A919K638_9ACTN|nr:SRPBCC family protein [Actinoplanes rishiriensis]GIE99409.1 hypothetical protein Ari01nite_68740 [Actinoplanes rishiriensis]